MHNIANSKHKFNNPFFIATVIDNKDPNDSYRVKVKVDILHDNVDNNNLPWAAKLGSSFLGIDGSMTSHSVPEIGSSVLVLAIGNDPNSLVYLGSLYKKTDSSPSGDNYLNTLGIYTKAGDFIGINKIENLLKAVWSGKIDIDVKSDVTIKINGNTNIETQNANIKTQACDVQSTECNITSTTCKITSGSLSMGTITGPNQFCSLPQCLFTSAPHQMPITGA